MKLLLDTHALLWWWSEPERLPNPLIARLSLPETEILASAVSAYELAYKHRLGKLQLPPGLLENFAAAVTAEQWVPLPVTLEHGRHAGSLASPHRDPFDRLLAAQSMLENAPLVTMDSAFSAFPGLSTHWNH